MREYIKYNSEYHDEWYDSCLEMYTHDGELGVIKFIIQQMVLYIDDNYLEDGEEIYVS